MTSVEISPSSARELTDRIKTGVDAIWELIKQAYQSRAWSALGYSSWDDYCTREFGTSRIRLPREERQEVVASMREIGMSTRAIASATGVSKPTVIADSRRAGGQELTTSGPAPVTGTDGKTYSPRPRPMPEFAPNDEIAPGITAAELDALNPEPAPRRPIPQPTGEPAGPRRPALEEQFFQATERLNTVITTIQNLGDDDRLPRNKEKVARYRNDLLNAIDVLQHVAETLNSH